MAIVSKPRAAADILFLVDTTNGMEVCLDAVREHIAAFAETLAGGPETMFGDHRAAVWVISDAEVAGSGGVIAVPFVATAPELRDQLVRLTPAREGGEASSLLDGLYAAATLGHSEKDASAIPNRWRYRSVARRVVVVYTASPFGPVMSAVEGGGVEAVAEAVADAGIAAILYAPTFPCFDHLSVLDKCEHTAFCPADHPRPAEALSDFLREPHSLVHVFRALERMPRGTPAGYDWEL